MAVQQLVGAEMQSQPGCKLLLRRGLWHHQTFVRLLMLMPVWVAHSCQADHALAHWHSCQMVVMLVLWQSDFLALAWMWKLAKVGHSCRADQADSELTLLAQAVV